MVTIIEFQSEDKREKDKVITSKKLEVNEELFYPEEDSEYFLGIHCFGKFRSV